MIGGLRWGASTRGLCLTVMEETKDSLTTKTGARGIDLKGVAHLGLHS